MATAGDIFNAAQQQISALQAIDNAIDAKISAIKAAQPGIPLTAVQLKTMSSLRQQQASVLGASEELAYVTMGALDNSGEINNLVIALASVVTNLNASAAAIAAIGGAATNIGTIASAISGMVPQLQALAKG
jgi:hypothetical protein